MRWSPKSESEWSVGVGGTSVGTSVGTNQVCDSDSRGLVRAIHEWGEARHTSTLVLRLPSRKAPHRPWDATRTQSRRCCTGIPASFSSSWPSGASSPARPSPWPSSVLERVASGSSYPSTSLPSSRSIVYSVWARSYWGLMPFKYVVSRDALRRSGP